MIQRIQTLYFLLTAVLSVVTACLPLGRWLNDGGEVVMRMGAFTLTEGDSTRLSPFGPLLIIVAVLMLLTIIIYRHRMHQTRLTVLCMLLLAGWYLVYGIYALICGADGTSFLPEWGAALPIVGIYLSWQGWRAVMKDELLVRSLDRLR